MNLDAKKLASPLTCPACRGRVDVKSRHVAVTGSAIRVYCSAECLRAGDAGPNQPAPPPIEVPPTPRRSVWWIAGGIVVSTTVLVTMYGGGGDARDAVAAQPPVVAAAIPPPGPTVAPAPEVKEDPRVAEDKALVGELMKDAWLHPLAGPTRRMPRNHNGAFGAERAGVRAPECVSGHCGVDLGRVWGEPVHAVHGGVIDWVNRGPNEERGGVFVKIAHRGGTLYSWYFHLAAVPRWVRPGAKVTAGQVIGLLGDTGIKYSAPHLHFAMSVKNSKYARERYLDPEPLIAIWPLWIPNENRSSGRVSTIAEPGIPVRAPSRRRPKKKSKRAKVETAKIELAADKPESAKLEADKPDSPEPAIESPVNGSPKPADTSVEGFTPSP